jgi:DNA-binding MarR family transcriptional regulator
MRDELLALARQLEHGLVSPKDAAAQLRTLVEECGPRGPLTRKQADVLDFLRGYAGEHGCTPTYGEIADYFGWKSLATVYEHLTHLQGAGYIRRKYNTVRGVTLL